MFQIFKRRKKLFYLNNSLVGLCELSLNEFTPNKFEELLNQEVAVWMLNIISRGCAKDFRYELNLFKKEKNYIVKYCAKGIGYPFEIHLQISEIFRFTYSNVCHIFNKNLRRSSKLFYDENKIIYEQCKFEYHYLTKEKIEEKLTFAESFKVD